MRLSLLHTLLMALFIYVRTSTAQEMVTDVSCTLDDTSQQSDELLRIAAKLITLKKDAPFTRALQRESVGALKMCRLFETVTVEHDSGRVTFRLKPARYVRDIHYWQEYPLFRDDVEKVLSTYPGDVFTDSLPAQQKSLVYALYKREGFIRPWVGVTAYEHPAGNDQILRVHVHPGLYYRLKTLKIEGNHALSDFTLKRKMKIWRSSLFPGSAGRFVEPVLREDIKSLVKLYQAHNFSDVKIRDTVITNQLTRTVSVVITVEEGSRYRFTLSKQRTPKLSAGILKKEIVLYKTGNRNNIGIRKSVKAIGKRLYESGFLDAQISISDTAKEHRNITDRLVHIAVHQGPRTTVSSIAIEGAAHFDETTIREQMLLVDHGNADQRAYTPDRLQEDVFAVQMLYRSHGYLKASVSSTMEIDNYLAAITIHIAEGVQTRINSLSFTTDRAGGIEVKKAVKIREGDPYQSSLLKRDALSLQSLIAETGYPRVTVTPAVTMNSDSSSAAVLFTIDEGALVTLGDVHYTGAFRTKEKILDREFKGLPGKPLSLRHIVDAQKEVRNMGLFSSVRFRTIGLAEKKDTVHLFVEVTEKRPYYGALGGGYESDKGLFINSKVGDRNMLGLNKEIWVGGELSHQLTDRNKSTISSVATTLDFRFEAGTLDPRVLGSPLRSQTEVYIERVSPLNQNFRSRAHGITNGLTVSPTRHVTLGMGSGYELRRQFLEDGTTVIPDIQSGTERPRNIFTLTPSVAWDRRDSFTRPRKGWFAVSSVDFSKSMDKGNMLDNFMKVKYEAKEYYSPFAFLTLATVVRGGYIVPFGGTLPADKLFYLGGTGDVRGFAQNLLHPAEDSTIGTGNAASLSASIEARIDIGYNFELALFTDVGRLEKELLPLSAAQFRTSAGTGIRYITPIGPIGVLYGWKLDHEAGDIGTGAFHFSLGYTF